MQYYYIDTNVILRYLLKDNVTHFESVRRIFEKAERKEIGVKLDPMCLAEIIYVLAGYYERSRAEIVMALKSLIVHVPITMKSEKAAMRALDFYEHTGCDFADCYVAACAIEAGESVLSFDKDFKKFKGVSWCNPVDF